MMTKQIYTILAVLACIATGCTSAKTELKAEAAPETLVHVYGGGKTSTMPKAVVYKTNGEYADNVFVNLSADGSRIVSYPAPGDVSASSAALSVGDGWMLDRRGGIGKNSAFLDITYAEYAKMASTPSVGYLMQHIIPGAKVTAVQVLPITAQQAISDPADAYKYIKQ